MARAYASMVLGTSKFCSSQQIRFCLKQLCSGVITGRRHPRTSPAAFILVTGDVTLYAQTSLALRYELSVTHTPGRSLYVKLECLAIMRNEDKHVSVGRVREWLLDTALCLRLFSAMQRLRAQVYSFRRCCSLVFVLAKLGCSLFFEVELPGLQ